MGAPHIHLRPARAADHSLVARLHPDLNTGDPPPSQARWSDAVPSSLIAEVDAVAVGFIRFDLLDGVGYIRQIVVDEAQRGHGIGRALVLGARARFESTGCRRWCLNVKPRNLPAVQLYESVGMKQVHASASFRFDWSLVESFPAPTLALDCVTLEPQEFAAAERAMDIDTGTLASRASSSRVRLMRLRDPAAPGDQSLGLASFDIEFPGCFPFRVREPSYAAPLLRGLKMHAVKANMGVVIEADPELDAYLCDAGAEVGIRFVHMSGPIG